MSNNKNIKPLISIVIVNWNGIDDTIECLKSLRKLTYPNYEIIVVDNGSVDESVEKLEVINDIQLVKLDYNTGFTGGHIEGLKKSKGDYVALLNNDLVVHPSWLNELYNTSKYLGSDIVGGRSYSWNSKQKVFDETNEYSSFQTVNPVTGHTFTLNTGENSVFVNSISGSNLLISKKLINDVGYLDNDFFAYYEETDLIARSKSLGYKASYSPNAKVWHKGGESSKNIPFFYYYQMHRNRYLFANKNFESNYFRKFKKYYRKEFFISLRNYSKNKESLYDKAMIKSFVFTRLNYIKLLIQRNKIQKISNKYISKILSKDENQSTVTVAITCYNYANYIIDAIKSAESQSFEPAEIIILNDGSTDESENVIKRYMSNRTSKVPIKYILQKNSGVVSAKNRLIKMIKTPWVIFLDADDVLAEDYIENILNFARSNNYDVVYTDMEFFGSINDIQKVKKYNKYLLRSVNFIHNSALMNINALRLAGGYSEEMYDGFEDWELNLRLSKITNRFGYVEKPLLKYRRHESASRDSSANLRLPLVIKKLERLHPDLYNFRFYFWLENNRLIEALKVIIKYPFYVLRHAKSHTHKAINERTNND